MIQSETVDIYLTQSEIMLVDNRGLHTAYIL